MDIRRLTVGDERAVDECAHLFDHAPQELATRRFLAQPGHHLLVAYVEGEPAGFVSGVEMTHPDKGTEMFLYELGVDQRFRRRGFGTALVGALAELARAAGCYGMWVLTDAEDGAAMGTYTSAGGADLSEQTMLSWTFARP